MNAPYKRKVHHRFERDAQSFDVRYRLERSPFWRLVKTTLRKPFSSATLPPSKKLGT